MIMTKASNLFLFWSYAFLKRPHNALFGVNQYAKSSKKATILDKTHYLSVNKRLQKLTMWDKERRISFILNTRIWFY